MHRRIRSLLVLAVLLLAAPVQAQPSWPNETEGDFVIKDFSFAEGGALPALRLHYITLGTPKRDAAGAITNGVLLLHGTSGTGENWLLPTLADELFKPGQPLDAGQYFIILPTAVGRGKSSKPSDGLRMQFPHYRYRDIVASEYRLVTEGLGIKHLRLVMGSSMGGMQSWMWAETYPDFMDGVVPIASQPIRISGRNWISRRIAIEAIRHDPDWRDGNYSANPTHYIWTAPMGALATESVVRLQEMAPSVEAGDALYRKWVEAAAKGDANDSLYGTEAVMDYNPEPDLGRIKAPLMAINFGDDEVNDAGLGVVAPAIARIPHAKLVMVPPGPESHGHFTHLRAAVWKAHLAAFLQTLP